jgi:Tfp pilus assembly protein PilF
VYLTALQNQFVEWDDSLYIFRNPFIRSFDLVFLRRVFFDFTAGNWHPLTWISHALDYAFWGLDPLGHHLTNNILHAVATFLVVVLLAGLMEQYRDMTAKNGQSAFLNGQGILITAGISGLLFGLHPVHVESVAWVSERKDLLCSVFFLLSIIMYAKSVRSADFATTRASLISRVLNRRYLLSFGFFILALLSKPMAVTLPAILLILDWYPFGKIRSLKTLGTAFAEKLPFIALSALLSLLTIQAQSSSSALGVIPLSMQLTVAAKSFVAYLWKMMVPLHLSPFYPYPYPDEVSLLSPEYLLPIGLATWITIACVSLAKKQKLWLSVWSYYVVTLLPVTGIIQVGSQSMADRYTYLPSLGPFLLMGLAAASAMRSLQAVKKHRHSFILFCTAVVIFVFVLIAYLTIHQIGIWKNSITLWSHVIQEEPERVPLAYNNRGLAFEEQGLLDKAAADFYTAITLDPFFYKAYENLGMLYGKAGLYDKSIEFLSRAISMNPKSAVSYSNRGLSYFHSGQYERALRDFTKAIELDQRSAFIYMNRANLYRTMGNKEHAISDFLKACALGDREGCAASTGTGY